MFLSIFERLVEHYTKSGKDKRKALAKDAVWIERTVIPTIEKLKQGLSKLPSQSEIDSLRFKVEQTNRAAEEDRVRQMEKQGIPA